MVKKSVYTKKIIKEKTVKHGKERTIQLYRNDKKNDISAQDIRDIVQGLKNADPNKIFMVRALNATRWSTLKGFYSDLNVDDEEEYYANKVKDTDKFSKFSQLQITAFVPDDIEDNYF